MTRPPWRDNDPRRARSAARRAPAIDALLIDASRSDRIISAMLGGTPSVMTTWRIRQELEAEQKIHVFTGPRHMAHSSACWCWHQSLPDLAREFVHQAIATQALFEEQAAAIVGLDVDQGRLLTAAVMLWGRRPLPEQAEDLPRPFGGSRPTQPTEVQHEWNAPTDRPAVSAEYILRQEAGELSKR